MHSASGFFVPMPVEQLPQANEAAPRVPASPSLIRTYATMALFSIAAVLASDKPADAGNDRSDAPVISSQHTMIEDNTQIGSDGRQICRHLIFWNYDPRLREFVVQDTRRISCEFQTIEASGKDASSPKHPPRVRQSLQPNRQAFSMLHRRSPDGWFRAQWADTNGLMRHTSTQNLVRTYTQYDPAEENVKILPERKRTALPLPSKNWGFLPWFLRGW